MVELTPTFDPGLPRRHSDFPTMVDALEYAAGGVRGLNFYTGKGVLESSITYAEMRDRAVEIARQLTGLGLEKGARVAMVADTSVNFICFFMGAQYASVLPVPLPLPTSFSGRDGYVEQLARQLKSCGASALITPEIWKDLVLEATAGLDMVFAGTVEEFDAHAPAVGEVRLPSADDLAYLQYSSGSTRFPHGISVTHRSLMANCHGMGLHGIHLRDDDRCVSWLPFYHDMGLVGTFLTAAACQISVDYMATEDFARRPLMWLTLMDRNKSTITYSPTFGYDICARRIGPDALARLDLSRWRVAGIGGDMIRPDVMRQFAETFAPAGFDQGAFMASYGLAECTLAVSFMPPGRGIEIDLVDEKKLAGGKAAEPNAAGPDGSDLNGHQVNGTLHRLNGQVNGSAVNGHALNGHALNGHALNGQDGAREIVNCGVPLPEYKIEIRGKDGVVIPDHEIGRVYVRGESVMQGYFNDEEATRQVLCDDGWLDTGDMGYMLDGSLYIVGREKDLIIVNGRNHWPQDIEWAAEQLPGVRNGDIAAISVPGENDEEILTVLVHCRQRNVEDRLEFEQLIKNCIMETTGVNCQIALVPPRSLPRTSSGKLSRAKARERFLSGGLTADAG